MDQASEQSKPKRRRWWQFTLRTLLIAMLLASLPLAWVGNELANKRNEEALSHDIHQAGGRAVFTLQQRLTFPPESWYSNDDPFHSVTAWNQSYRISEVHLTARTATEFRILLRRVNRLSYLQSLDVSDSWLKDADLGGISDEPLSDLDLMGTGVTDECIPALVRLPKLKRLALDFTTISDAGLAKLVSSPSLAELDVSGTLVTPEGIAKLCADRPGLVVRCEGQFVSPLEVTAARFLRLQGWRVEFQRSIGDGAISVDVPRRAEELSKLEVDCLKCFHRLHLHITMDSPRGISAILPELKGLERLDSYQEATGADLRRISRCKKLTFLNLSNHSLSDQDLAVFPELADLQTLDLSGNPISSDGIEYIFKLTKLHSLSLHGSFTANDLSRLSDLKRLTDLSLAYSKFEYNAIPKLANLENLESLDLRGANLDDEGLASLLNLKRLVVLNLYGTRISDEGLLKLAQMPSLKYLNTPLSDDVTDHGRKQFRKLRPDVNLSGL